jgi:predicted nucleic acid-binding protein
LKIVKRMKKIYLDTSVVSALFDDRMLERKHLTEEFWGKLPEYDVYFSAVRKEEISFTTSELKGKMLEKIKELKILETTDEVEDLADEYIKRGIFPKSYRDDAIHAAVAVVNNMDFIVS